jgi:hypothetical protein
MANLYKKNHRWIEEGFYAEIVLNPELGGAPFAHVWKGEYVHTGGRKYVFWKEGLFFKTPLNGTGKNKMKKKVVDGLRQRGHRPYDVIYEGIDKVVFGAHEEPDKED